MEFTVKERYTVEDLRALTQRLRIDCPWDRKQTHESIRKNLIEETYEVCDAIDKGDEAGLKEELGDLLLQVMLHARMEEEQGHFDMDDVADGICKKLVYRHPHIFGEVEAESSDEVLRNWEELKKKEKDVKRPSQHLQAVPASFPALMRAQKLQKRATIGNLCYKKPEEAIEVLKNQLFSLDKGIKNCDNVEEDLGGVLFAAVQVAGLVGADAEELLSETCDRFTYNFAKLEKACEMRCTDIGELTDREYTELWCARGNTTDEKKRS